jgi:hypothetical protein
MPNGLTEIVLQPDPPFDMLADVRSGEPHPDGGDIITPQPFELDGKDKRTAGPGFAARLIRPAPRRPSASRTDRR